MRTFIAIVVLVAAVACSGAEQSTSSNALTSATKDTMLINAKGPAEDLIRNSEQFKQMTANVQAQIARRVPLSFAFVNAPLPNGAIAVVRVNQLGPRSAYVIVRQESFDSRVYIRSQAARIWMDQQLNGSNTSAEITLFADGRIVADAEGQRFDHFIKELSDRPDSSGVGGRLLKQMKKATSADVPGFGEARVIDPK